MATKKSLLTAFLIATIICGLAFAVNTNSASESPSTASASNIVAMVPSMAWNRTYEGSNLQSVWIVIQAADGGFLLGGMSPPNNATPGIGLLKVDSLGNPQWNKTYLGGAGIFGKWLVRTIDGGYVFAGQHAGSCWLAKVDGEGNMQWNQTYNEAGIGAASAVTQTNDGGYALTGNGASFIWLMKTDALGNEQWNTTLGDGNVDSVIQTSDGGYALTSHTTKMIIYMGKIEIDCLLMKTDSKGTVQWSQMYPDFGWAWSIVQTGDGGYALGSGTNIAVVKTDALGNLQWTQYYDGGQGWSMIKTSDGGFAISGTALVKTDAGGNEQWALSFDESNSTSNQAYSVIQTNDGGYAVAGEASFYGGIAGWLAKIDLTTSLSPSPSTTPSVSPTNSATPTLSPAPSSSPSPSIPEFPSWIILLIALMTAITGSLLIKEKCRRRLRT